MKSKNTILTKEKVCTHLTDTWQFEKVICRLNFSIGIISIVIIYLFIYLFFFIFTGLRSIPSWQCRLCHSTWITNTSGIQSLIILGRVTACSKSVEVCRAPLNDLNEILMREPKTALPKKYFANERHLQAITRFVEIVSA